MEGKIGQVAISDELEYYALETVLSASRCKYIAFSMYDRCTFIGSLLLGLRKFLNDYSMGRDGLGEFAD